MVYTPLQLKTSGDIQQETRENIEPGFGAEFVARFTQGNIAGSTIRQFVFNQNEEQDARLKDPQILSPEEANAQYGIENLLEFQGNISRGEAALKKFRVVQNQDKERFIAKAASREGVQSKVGNLFIALGSMALSPESFIPFGELLQLRSVGALSKLGPMGKAVTRGAVDGVLGNAVAMPASIDNFDAIGEEYTATDALIDVGAGALFGGSIGGATGAFKVNSVLSKRAKRVESYLGEFAVMDTQKKVLKQQLTPEAATGLDVYLNAVENPDMDMVRAIGKLGDVYSSEVDKAPHFLLNDTLLRTNFDELGDDALRVNIELLGNARFVPDSLSLDLPRAKNLFELGRVSELPPELASILSKVQKGKASSKFENFITIRELTESLSELSTLTNYRNIISDVIGKRFKTNSIISEKQAFAIYQELDELQRLTKDLPDPDQILNTAREFQIDLKKANDGTNLKFETYSKKLNSFKRLLDENPDIRRMSISDLKNLDPETRGKVTELMRYLQQANPNEAQLRGFLRGDKDIFREIFEAAKINKEMKDTLTQQEALKILEEGIQKPVDPIEPNLSPMGEDNARFTENLRADTNYLNEKTEQFKLDLDEDEIAQVEELATKEDNTFRKIAKGAKEALNCFMGN